MAIMEKSTFLWVCALVVVGQMGFLEGEQKIFTSMMQQLGDNYYLKSPITISFVTVQNNKNGSNTDDDSPHPGNNIAGGTTVSISTTQGEEQEEVPEIQTTTTLLEDINNNSDGVAEDLGGEEQEEEVPEIQTTTTTLLEDINNNNDGVTEDLGTSVLSDDSSGSSGTSKTSSFIATTTANNNDLEAAAAAAPEAREPASASSPQATVRKRNKRGKRKAAAGQQQQQQQQQQQASHNNNRPPIHPSIRDALKPDDRPCGSYERRALAMRGDDATEQEWEAMTHCVIEQDMLNRTGFFAQHISKAGGSSMNHVLKINHCKADRPGEIGFATNWYKPERLERYSRTTFQKYFHVNEDRTLVQGVSCDLMHETMHKKHWIGIMDEGVIPFDSSTQPTLTGDGDDDLLRTHNRIGVRGGCPTTLNAVLFREPIKRLESHYKHMYRLGRKGPKGKEDWIAEGTDGKFDVRYLSRALDIVSDNYYTRHLVGHGYFVWEPKEEDSEGNVVGPKSLIERPDAWTKIFPIANASLHNMDWIPLLDSDRPKQTEETELILQYGLGLENPTLVHDRVAKNSPPSTAATTAADDKPKPKESQLSDPEFAKQLNGLDLALWEEALKLNRLDLVSIERMKPYYEAAIEKSKPRVTKKMGCCGRVCMERP